jgi:peroxiredoxin Q/BCP
MLEKNQKAPNFTLLDANSEEYSLSDFAGKYTLLYFYPKDDTPGCTKEACIIRDMYNEFEKRDVYVVGISSDSPESHKKFAEKYELPFILLSDPDKKVITAYDAKNMFMPKRVSYLLNPNGEIVRVYPDVDPANHAKQILDDVDEIIS